MELAIKAIQWHDFALTQAIILATAMVAVGMGGIPGYARPIRSAALTVRRKEYVEAARALAAPALCIVLGTVLPNIVSPLIVPVSYACRWPHWPPRRFRAWAWARSRPRRNGAPCW